MDVVSASRRSLTPCFFSIETIAFPSRTRLPIGHAPVFKAVVWDSTEDAPEARRTTLGGRRLVGVFFAEGFRFVSSSPGARAVARVTMSRRARSHLSRRLRASDARDSRAARGRVRARAASTQVRGDSLGGGCRQHHRPFAASAGAAGPEALGMTKVLFVEVGMGADQHGQDATKAAVRACRNAIEFNSIPSIRDVVPGGYDKMLLHIQIGVPRTPGGPREGARGIPLREHRGRGRVRRACSRRVASPSPRWGTRTTTSSSPWPPSPSGTDDDCERRDTRGGSDGRFGAIFHLSTSDTCTRPRARHTARAIARPRAFLPLLFAALRAYPRVDSLARLSRPPLARR